MLDSAYRVLLDDFEGPMDLLLYLIRKEEVDIHDIPIARITDQFLAHVERVERVDIELAGEFLVMAATLMETKSRMLRPVPEGEQDADAQDHDDRRRGRASDPRADLVRQLLEYKRYRDAADRLDDRRARWEQRFEVRAGTDDAAVRAAFAELGELEIEDLDLADLVEAFQGVLASVNFERLGDHQIVADDTPIELYAEEIAARLADAPAQRVGLRDVLAGRSRAEMIGLFLALLTLIRDQRAVVRMGEQGVEIGAGTQATQR
jgi:segregation and condensation protein A